MHETMCIENIGQTTNRGYKIPHGKPIRMINAALNNNPSATALTDDEIEELSKYNEGAFGPGETEQDVFYQICFSGKVSFDNICYAIIRPCRCVKSHDGDIVTLKTAKISAMHTITRLIKRLKEDEISSVEIYRYNNDDSKTLIARFDSMEFIIPFIQEDRIKRKPALKEFSEDNQKQNTKALDNTDELDTLKAHITFMQKEIDDKNNQIELLNEEVKALRAKIDEIKEIVEK